MRIILDGDHPGHAFRGNQHVSASGESSIAVRSSRKAKRAEKSGDPEAQKKAHRAAAYAHLAAMEDAKGITRKYHATMAKFHGGRGGVKVKLDTAMQVPAGEALQPAGPVLDADDDEPMGTLLDDATGGLFGDGDSGYIVGTISRNGVSLATVHLREDGMVKFGLTAELRDHISDFTDDDREDIQDIESEGWTDGWATRLSALAEATEDIETAAQRAARREAEFAEEDRKRAEREALMKASEEARAAALRQAQEFGQGKPGFVAAIADEGADAIKAALARKPLGSFIFVVARQSGGAGHPDTFGFLVWSRQTIGKRGRINDPEGGKPGNALASRMMDTPAEAYEQAVANISKIGGVLPGMGPVSVSEANEAWETLQYSVNNLQGHTETELARQGSENYLLKSASAVRALIARGWPEKARDPSSLLASADRIVQRAESIRATGGPQEVGRGDAMSYYLTGSGLTQEQIDAILAKPTRVQKSGAFEVPIYNVAELKAAIEAAKQPAAANDPVADPVADPAPAAEPPELATLREIIAGQHDAMPIADLLEKLTKASEALEAAGLLTGDAEALAVQALDRWADLEQKASA